jgi:DNA invertase Pin-like site-specific DNA recombinase
MVNKKRMQHGVRHHNAKLTETNIMSIRDKLKEGITQAKIAKEFGVQQSQISRINTGLRWEQLK